MAIALSLVLIHVFELIPMLEPIRTPPKNFASARPILDFLQMYVDHFFCAHTIGDIQDDWMWVVVAPFVLGIEH